ncbi:MAG: FHA domain-containing protein [Proteobacteria bacterium]|nr:FHA domain-containing protein [Pseudomonadota bacterium]
MKLVFPHNEHKDIELVSETLTIGSSPDADIQIDSIGMSAIHVTLVTDGKDFSLKVANPAAMASVNGRLVKDVKEVRVGDLIILSQVHCKIVDDTQPEPVDDNRTRIRMALPKFVLRGVSGVYFGKIFPLRGKTSLGRHSDNDIFINVDGISRKHAVISVLADGLQIEDMDSSNGTYVNGTLIDQPTSLNIDDEVKLDNIRFLIQAPGMPAVQTDSTTASNSTPNTDIIKPSQFKPSSIAASSSSAGKWVITILILIAAATGGAWYMGLLDKFLGL